MKWVYMAVPVTPALELASRVAFATPAKACEVLQNAFIGAILQELEKQEGTDQVHAMVEDIAGELHQLWENGEISMVKIVEERLPR